MSFELVCLTRLGLGFMTGVKDLPIVEINPRTTNLKIDD